jgi:hypothetical protein
MTDTDADHQVMPPELPLQRYWRERREMELELIAMQLRWATDIVDLDARCPVVDTVP